MAGIGHAFEDFAGLVAPLIGLPVAEPWKGYGSAIFLELGQLSSMPVGKRSCVRGEASISVEWDWRVECGTSILYGSSNSGPEISRGIEALLDATIQSVAVVGRVPELVVEFSNGHCLRSMAMVAGDPEWMIRLPGERHVYAKAGQLVGGKETSRTDGEKRETMFAAEERIAARWAVPCAEPMQGRCRDCAWYMRLDGNGPLLDYGVCGFKRSPFDGRVVNRGSGCPSFAAKGETDG